MKEDSLFDLEKRTPALIDTPTLPSSDTGSDSVCPGFLEYTPLASTAGWRVEKFDLLAAEFGLGPPWVMSMMALHEVAESGQVGKRESEQPPTLPPAHSPTFTLSTRGWLIVRRLFGVMPMLLPKEAAMDDFRVWGRSELAAALGISVEQLQAELDAVRVGWMSYLRREGSESTKEGDEEEGIDKGSDKGFGRELKFGHEVLERYGFSEEMFEVSWYDFGRKVTMSRPPAEARRERDRFAGWVAQWAKMFQEPMAEPIARQALLNRLYLERISVEMSRVPSGSPEFEKMARTMKSMEETVKEQLEKLEELFPEMGGIAGKVSFRAVISELNKGYRDYYGNADNRLVNKIHTAAELEVELRQSVQDPGVRLRFGLNVAIIEAMQGLFDPHWRSKFKPAVLKKLDAAARKAVEEARVASGEALVDLEAEGEKGEYPEMVG